MTTAPAADWECVVQIPTEFYNEVMQAFIQTWDEQMRKQLEWTDAEEEAFTAEGHSRHYTCLLYTSPSPRDGLLSRMPSSA